MGDLQHPPIAISLTAGGIDTLLCSLPSAGQYSYGLYSPFVQGPDGNLYTVTSSGCVNGLGGIIRVPLVGAASTLYSFATQDETMLTDSPLLAGLDGALYGVTSSGGDNNNGAIVRISLTGSKSIVCSFPSGYELRAPNSLVQAADGSFYGRTSGLPFYSIFHYSPSDGLSTIYRESGQGSPPVIGPDGSVYFYVPLGFGERTTLFRMDPLNYTVSVAHSFPAYPGDATIITGLLSAGTDGMLYAIGYRDLIGVPMVTDMLYRIAPSGDDAPATSTPYNSSPDFYVFTTRPMLQGPDGFYGVEWGSVDIGSAAYYKLSASQKPAYTVTTSPSDSALAPIGGGQYAYNTTATVHAQPNQSFEFTGWTEDGIEQSLSPDYTFTVLRDRNLQANYVETFYVYVSGKQPLFERLVIFAICESWTSHSTGAWARARIITSSGSGRNPERMTTTQALICQATRWE